MIILGNTSIMLPISKYKRNKTCLILLQTHAAEKPEDQQNYSSTNSYITFPIEVKNDVFPICPEKTDTPLTKVK